MKKTKCAELTSEKIKKMRFPDILILCIEERY